MKNNAPIVSDCKACGRRFTVDAWIQLPLVGLQESGIQFVVLELRNCHCTRGGPAYTQSAAKYPSGQYLSTEAFADLEAEHDRGPR